MDELFKSNFFFFNLVLVVGDKKVGKLSLANRFIFDKLSDSKDLKKEIESNNKNIEVQIIVATSREDLLELSKSYLFSFNF